MGCERDDAKIGVHLLLEYREYYPHREFHKQMPAFHIVEQYRNNVDPASAYKISKIMGSENEQAINSFLQNGWPEYRWLSHKDDRPLLNHLWLGTRTLDQAKSLATSHASHLDRLASKILALVQ
jgi:hypothetical protein